MQPLETFPAAELRRIKGVFADIDDTITSDGHLTADAYRALEQLQDAGLQVFPITGRPAGWCDHIARMWPVDGVVGENGAFYFRYDHGEKRFTKRYVLDDAERAASRETYAALAEEILEAVPGSAVASDQLYREADLAIDFCEDMIRAGMETMPDDERKGRIYPVCGDGEVLPAKDQSFWGITVAFGVRNLSQTLIGLEEMRRVLKPGGKLLILEFSRPRNPFFKPSWTP